MGNKDEIRTHERKFNKEANVYSPPVYSPPALWTVLSVLEIMSSNSID
jgi:hypothetical protein